MRYFCLSTISIHTAHFPSSPTRLTRPIRIQTEPSAAPDLPPTDNGSVFIPSILF